MLTAETTILFHLKTLGGILLVLHGIVIPLLAFVTSENYFYSHVSAPPFLPPCLKLTDQESPFFHKNAHGNKPVCRQVKWSITQRDAPVKSKLQIFLLFAVYFSPFVR